MLPVPAVGSQNHCPGWGSPFAVRRRGAGHGLDAAQQRRRIARRRVHPGVPGAPGVVASADLGGLGYGSGPAALQRRGDLVGKVMMVHVGYLQYAPVDGGCGASGDRERLSGGCRRSVRGGRLTGGPWIPAGCGERGGSCAAGWGPSRTRGRAGWLPGRGGVFRGALESGRMKKPYSQHSASPGQWPVQRVLQALPRWPHPARWCPVAAQRATSQRSRCRCPGRTPQSGQSAGSVNMDALGFGELGRRGHGRAGRWALGGGRSSRTRRSEHETRHVENS